MGWNHPIFHGFGFFTYQRSMVDTWKAQNILTSSLT